MSLTLTLGPYTLSQGTLHGEDGEPEGVALRRLRAEFAAARGGFAALLDGDDKTGAALSRRARPDLLFALWLLRERDFSLVRFAPPGGVTAWCPARASFAPPRRGGARRSHAPGGFR